MAEEISKPQKNKPQKSGKMENNNPKGVYLRCRQETEPG